MAFTVVAGCTRVRGGRNTGVKYGLNHCFLAGKGCVPKREQMYLAREVSELEKMFFGII